MGQQYALVVGIQQPSDVLENVLSVLLVDSELGLRGVGTGLGV